jgi:AcrB/AcrD/AcrF family
MWIVRLALRRPYTFVVLAILILILGALSALRTPTDIFPNINIPVVSIIWNYNGLAPQDMASRIITLQERNLTTTVNDIEHLESQSLNGVAVIKVFFHPGANISTVAALPTILRVPLEAQQRKIRGTASLLGIVAHCGLFLVAVDGQHCAVQIENDLRRAADHLRPPTVVQLEQGLPSGASEPFEEAPQARGCRISRQTRQVMKHSVVAQRFGGLDPSQAEHQGVEQRFQRFADAVAVVPLDKANVSRQGPLQTEALKELLDKSYAPKLSQADPIEGDAQISCASGHWYQTPLLVRFRSKTQNSFRTHDSQPFRAQAFYVSRRI